MIAIVGAVFVLGFIIGNTRPKSVEKEKPIQTQEEQILSSIGTEVLPNIFDDGRSTVYIKADRQRTNEADKQLKDILNKKRNWKKQFPDKRVISLSVVTSDNDSFYGGSLVVGLLIEYELRK